MAAFAACPSIIHHLTVFGKGKIPFGRCFFQEKTKLMGFSPGKGRTCTGFLKKEN